MSSRFIDEPIAPDTRTSDTHRMAAGEPGLPRAFLRGDQRIEIAEVLRSWKSTGPCRHGSGEAYVRKHWYEVRTVSGARMTVYFDRQPTTKRGPVDRWWLFTVEDEA